MARWKWSIAELRETEVAGLRDKLRVAMAALDVVTTFGHEVGDDCEQAVTDMTAVAEWALQRIEGDE